MDGDIIAYIEYKHSHHAFESSLESRIYSHSRAFKIKELVLIYLSIVQSVSR
jgi:hypothetical protein